MKALFTFLALISTQTLAIGHGSVEEEIINGHGNLKQILMLIV